MPTLIPTTPTWRVLRWFHTVSNTFSYNLTFSRLYVKLRADANGRDWRPEVVDTEFDPGSIVEYPVTIFNPDDEVVFVQPGPGLITTTVSSTLWHDHYVIEYTVKAAGSVYSKDTRNRLYFGGEIKPQEMQWIDITVPGSAHRYNWRTVSSPRVTGWAI